MEPPFLRLGGYRDYDFEGTNKDWTKTGAEKREKTETYQYVTPAWLGYLAESEQRSSSNCGFFEAQFYKCFDAYGTKLGKLHCDLEHRDLNECITNDKKFKRYIAMKDVRFKQWLRGERKLMFEPIEDYLKAVKYDIAGMSNKAKEDKKH